MIASHIDLILIVTGALTASVLLMFITPLSQLRRLFGEAPADPVTLLLARQLGVIVASFGALLIYAAFEPALRVPVLIAAVAEKLVFATLLLKMRGRGTTRLVAGADIVMSLIYIAYLAGL